MNEIRLAWRSLSRTPGMLSIAIGALALGIGANTVMFSIVSGVLLRPLPYSQPERLVQLTEIDRSGDADGAVFYQDVDAWRRQSEAFESVVIYGNSSKTLQNVAAPERLSCTWSERSLFRMLGANPVVGRAFRDDDPAGVVVVSGALARRRLGGIAGAVGRKLTLDGQPFTVIGVMPDWFQFPYRTSRTDLWLPWTGLPQTPNPNYRVDHVAARLKRGVTLDAVRGRLPASQGRTAQIAPLIESVTGRERPALLTLLGAVAMVLSIACVNVTNLLLARAAGRTHEMAVRIALGASRGRLARQLLTESLLIGVAGGMAGLTLAWLTTGAIVNLAAARIPRSWEIGLDWRVFVFLLAVCLITAAAVGLGPALLASSVDPQSGLKTGGRTSDGGSPGRRRLQDALVVVEIALACLLLAGAGVMLRTFVHLQSTPSGLAADRVLTARLAVVIQDYRAPGSFGRYVEALEGRVGRIPGVRSVGFIQYLPLANWGWSGGFRIVGQTYPASSPVPQAELRYVTPGYFRTLGIPIRRGRELTDRDSKDSPPVILINQALARRYFPNADPVGRATDRGTIVGVAGDVRQTGVDRPAAPEIYYTFAQNTAATSDAGVSLVVSTSLPPEMLVRAVSDAIHEINSNQAIFDVSTMRNVIAGSFAEVKFYIWLIGGFAAIALLLAASGIYGVMSHAVAARTREFAIRMALGADGGSIVRLVLGRGACLVICGLVLGAVGSLALTHTIRSVVRGTIGVDMLTLGATGAILSIVALAACVTPARRASKLEAASVMRE